jgi:hypothetical protein
LFFDEEQVRLLVSFSERAFNILEEVASHRRRPSGLGELSR